jgi:galactokinase
VPALLENASAVVPGRINLIGDHTDYTGGLVLPTIVDLNTTITGHYTETESWHLESQTHGSAVIPLDIDRADRIEPHWARYPAGVLCELRSLGIDVPGFTGSVSTTLPIGGGLSSSAALEVATARLALQGADGRSPAPHSLTEIEIAQLCQRAEQSATGVPCGIMDQLSIVSGRSGWATLIDCATLEITDVPIPEELVVEHRFITPRTLVGSEYSSRVAQCADIEAQIGPLREATIEELGQLDSDLLRRRARHVLTENIRVAEFAQSLIDGRFEDAGRLMVESHRSLAFNYETSTPLMDAAVDSTLQELGVLGARMTGGGFGGCIVVLRMR